MKPMTGLETLWHWWPQAWFVRDLAVVFFRVPSLPMRGHQTGGWRSLSQQLGLVKK